MEETAQGGGASVAERAFPNDRHSPSIAYESSFVSDVALNVGSNFGSPEICSGRRKPEVLASRMPVPKATVYKDRYVPLSKNQIGTSRNVFLMQAEPQPFAVQIATHGQFRLRILSPDSSHHSGANFWSDNVCHGRAKDAAINELSTSAGNGSMYKQVEFAREALYDLVWTRPVLVIAKEIGVSDVAVAKACRRADIPLPKRGHWAAAKSGRIAKPPPLPKAKSDQPPTVVFTVLENPPVRTPKAVSPAVQPIAVPTELTKPHRLVAELQAAAKGAREDKGVLGFNYAKVLRVRTSSQHLSRALILMDTLLKAFETQGYKVRVGERGETELVLKEGAVSFRLDERTKQTAPPPPPPRPSRGRAEPYYEPWRPAYILTGSGDFTLSFNEYQLRGCRHTWRDRAGKPLEGQLHEVLEALPSWEAKLKESRLQEEEREARARAAEERRVAAARAEEVLRRQRLRLVNNLVAWEQAERLRRFIAAVEEVGGDDIRAWLEWANAQVHALDPLCSDLSVITNLEVQLEPYFTGPPSWEKPAKDWWS